MATLSFSPHPRHAATTTHGALRTLALGVLMQVGCASAVAPEAPDVAIADARAAADIATGVDAPSGSDAGLCGFDDATVCAVGQTCLICGEGKGSRFSCVPSCESGADCTNPALPSCVRGGCNDVLYCNADTTACGCGICAAADTPIATPSGERVIADIREGDVVYGTRNAQLIPVHVLRISRRAVWNHVVMRVELHTGRVIEMSAGHPTIDGVRFGELSAGDDLGGVSIDRTTVVPYLGTYTHDLLTDGDRGAYIAAGVLVGSTLWNADGARPLAHDTARYCP